jgi:hypothetical protein
VAGQWHEQIPAEHRHAGIPGVEYRQAQRPRAEPENLRTLTAAIDASAQCAESAIRAAPTRVPNHVL